MTAHSRIGAAEKAISTAYTEASWRDCDTSHAAAVELEARKLLSETRPQLEREIRAELAAEIAAVRTASWNESPHEMVGVAFREGLRRAHRIVAPDVEAPVPGGRLTCDGCGFDVPALYVDDPSGQRWCGTCKATVSDGRADVSRCHLCGYASVSLDGTGDGRWVCQGGCAPDLPEYDPTDPALDGSGLSFRQLTGVACVECGFDVDADATEPVGEVPGYGVVVQCANGCGGGGPR